MIFDPAVMKSIIRDHLRQRWPDADVWGVVTCVETYDGPKWQAVVAVTPSGPLLAMEFGLTLPSPSRASEPRLTEF